VSRLAVISVLFLSPILAIILALLGVASLPANLMGIFLLIVGMTYTLGILIVCGIQKKRFWETSVAGKTLQEEHGDRSYWLTALGMLLGFFAPPLEYLYLKTILPRTDWMEIAGSALILLGIVLFVSARRALKSSYAGHLAVKEAQSLVKNGPYRFIRHPAYAGYFWMTLGLGLGYSSLAGIAIVFVLLLPGLAYRIRVEEKLLAAAFGVQYREYAARTAHLFPGLW
jgi:protein-S-isoprenylcysteine O-methyltransferase Ste14